MELLEAVVAGIWLAVFMLRVLFDWLTDKHPHVAWRQAYPLPLPGCHCGSVEWVVDNMWEAAALSVDNPFWYCESQHHVRPVEGGSLTDHQIRQIRQIHEQWQAQVVE